MNALEERRIGELAECLIQLADRLPTWLDAPPVHDLMTFEELEAAATDLWNLCREVQVKKDLTTCR